MTDHLLTVSVAKANPTDDELAAIVAVLSAASREDRLHAAQDRPLAGGWKSYYRTLRPMMPAGRDAWRTYHRM